MKVLVTGATGFLGSRLVKGLLFKGYEVTILKRSFSNTSRINNILGKVACYDLDRCKLDDPFKDQGKFDAVIHTATCYGRNGESDSLIFESNTGFPLSLLELSVNYNAGIFVNTDTILPKYINRYSLSKRHFVEWAKLTATTGNTQFINIKMEHIYGPGDDESKFAAYVIKSCLANIPELKLTLGEQKRDFIYIDDAVNAYLLLLRSKHVKTYQDFELGSGKSITIREFVEIIHRITGTNTILNFGAIPYREGEIMESNADISALEKLGWAPVVSLEKGISSCVREEL